MEGDGRLGRPTHKGVNFTYESSKSHTSLHLTSVFIDLISLIFLIRLWTLHAICNSPDTLFYSSIHFIYLLYTYIHTYICCLNFNYLIEHISMNTMLYMYMPEQLSAWHPNN